MEKNNDQSTNGRKKTIKPDSGCQKKDKKINLCSGQIPAWLTAIHFDNHAEWLAAYKKAPAGMVARAVLSAYRKRYFLSVDAAAKKLGVSKSAIMAWEAGRSNMQWNSKVHLVRSGQFHPEHLGGSGSGDEIGYFGDDANV